MYVRIIRNEVIKLGDFRARSNIKWATAMMLPEHVKLLREHRQNLNKQSKPILDEQEWEEINRQISEAMNQSLEITLTYFKNGEFIQTAGVPIRCNSFSKILDVRDDMENVTSLKMENIIEVDGDLH